MNKAVFGILFGVAVLSGIKPASAVTDYVVNLIDTGTEYVNQVGQVQEEITTQMSEYMNIKSESIGLIEAMGMFILPARLDRQLAQVVKVLKGKRDVGDDIAVHRAMIERLMSAHGNVPYAEGAELAVRHAVDEACEHILGNTAVFKEDERGESAFENFVRSCLTAEPKGA